MHAAEESAISLVSQRSHELAPYFIKGYCRHELNTENTTRLNHWIDVWASGIAVQKLANAASQFQGHTRSLVEQRISVGNRQRRPVKSGKPEEKETGSNCDWAGRLAEKLAENPNALLDKATIAKLTQESLKPEYGDTLVSSKFVRTSAGVKKSLKSFFVRSDFDGAVRFLVDLTSKGLDIPSKHFSIVFSKALKYRHFDTAARLLDQMRDHIDASTLHIFWLHLLRAQGTSVDEVLKILDRILPADFVESNVPPANVAIETFELLASYAATGLLRINEPNNVLVRRRLYLNSLYDRIISSDDIYLSKSRNVAVIVVSALLFDEYGLVVRVLRDATSQFGCSSFNMHEAHVIWTAADLKEGSSTSSPYELARLIVEQKCPELEDMLI